MYYGFMPNEGMISGIKNQSEIGVILLRRDVHAERFMVAVWVC